MTELLETAFARVRALPAERQDECAHLLMSLVEDEAEDAVYRLKPEEEEALAKSLEQAERGEYARDEEVRAI